MLDTEEGCANLPTFIDMAVDRAEGQTDTIYIENTLIAIKMTGYGRGR